MNYCLPIITYITLIACVFGSGNPNEMGAPKKDMIIYAHPMFAHLLVSWTNSNPGQEHSASPFDSQNAPSVSIQRYLDRIAKYAKCSPTVYVVALIMIDRFIHYNPDVSLTPFTIHRLIATSFVISIKLRDDIYYSMPYYAQVLGVKPADLCHMEIAFLRQIDFDLLVTPKMVKAYLNLVQTNWIQTAPNSGVWRPTTMAREG
eukprot:450321_1